MTPQLQRARQDLVRAAARHRRLLVAGLVAGAVATALPVVAPEAPETRPVLAAARDLAPGAALTDQDVRAVALPPTAVPEGALLPGAPVGGRRVAGAVRAGEPLTDVRLVGPGLLAPLGDRHLVAVPVRLVDAAATTLLRPGDRIDVLAAATDGARTDGPAVVVAAAAPVLAVPEQPDDTDGALVVLAAPASTAARLAAAAVTSRLSPVLLP